MGTASSTDSPPRAVASSVSGCVREVRTFLVHAEWSPDVLARVVTLFHRLNIEILALTMKRMPVKEGMTIRVTVKAESDRCERIEAHLYKVVQVRSVAISGGKKQDGKAKGVIAEV